MSETVERERTELLRQVDLFNQLDDAAVAKIAALVEPIHYDDGAAACQQGDEGDALFIVSRGMFAVSIAPPDGLGEIYLRTLFPRDVFGEMSLLTNEARSATIRAKGSSEVLRLDQQHFVNLVQQEPAIALAVAAVLSRRLRAHDRTIALDERVITEAQTLNQLLEEKVSERTRELEEAQIEIVERLAQAAEYRDDNTGEHIRRVGRLSSLLARELRLPEEDVTLIRWAAPLHDVGKIAVPDQILRKPGKLTDTEYAHMQTHTLLGGRILAGGNSPVVRLAEAIALSHHERWDGTGYPNRLAGNDIPLPGRIVAVADVFDALTSDRPYREAWTTERALTEIEAGSGSHFDPKVVQAIVRLHLRGKLV